VSQQRCELWNTPWCPTEAAGDGSSSCSGWGGIPAEQAAVLQKQCNAERARARVVGKRENAQRSEFGWCLSLLLRWWKLLAAALHEAALLENNFLLYSNLVERMPQRN